METENNSENSAVKSNFITAIIDKDLTEQANLKEIITRFPPEPNGYLHIGHAKSICLNFGLAEQYKGKCNLRMDDTNPSKEEDEYVQSITEDVKWLGFDWQDRFFFASDYYDRLYDFAVDLIKQGKAYVCDLTAEEIRHFRGTLTAPGKESPHRNRSVEENLELFARMKAGEFEEGSKILRAKIDMASPNINMRDPAIYRILKQDHHRTGSKWCIYPMYDFAHPLSDALEGITHSICTLEFEDHRPLYNWFIENCKVPAKPKQIEFARLNITHTVLSKRKLLELVEKKYVSGWDDPRMPTIAGIRRRGYSAEAIREFCNRIGVAKANSLVDIGLLNFCLREDLNKKAMRVMAVLKPLKVVITNYPDGQTEELEAENNPEDPSMGKRSIPFGKEIYIEQDDFMENPPKGYFRMFPGSEVRLKHAYYVKCEKVIKNASGQVVELQCTYDPTTKGGWSNDGRKVKGTLHWVLESKAIEAEIRLFDHLFTKENMDDLAENEDYKTFLNPNSQVSIAKAKLEPSLALAKVGQKYQFLRQGYFCVDAKDSDKDKLVFNRIVDLKDTWGKKQ